MKHIKIKEENNKVYTIGLQEGFIVLNPSNTELLKMVARFGATNKGFGVGSPKSKKMIKLLNEKNSLIEKNAKIMKYQRDKNGKGLNYVWFFAMVEGEPTIVGCIATNGEIPDGDGEFYNGEQFSFVYEKEYNNKNCMYAFSEIVSGIGLDSEWVNCQSEIIDKNKLEEMYNIINKK